MFTKFAIKKRDGQTKTKNYKHWDTAYLRQALFYQSRDIVRR